MSEQPSQSSSFASPPQWLATRFMAAGILLWFEILALVIGLAQFAVATENLTRPTLAAAVLIQLLVVAVITRVVPYFKKHLRQRFAIETISLIIMGFGMSYATGAIHSPVLALFILPLTAASIALGRWAFGITAIVIALCAVILGATTPGISIQSASFTVWLIGTLMPAVIATTAIAVLIEQMQGAERYIEDISATDRLTGLLNQRAFEDILAREHRKAERHGRPYCILIVDVENIGNINTSLGHDAGNKLIVAVAAAISRSIRATDVAARFGGDEFAILLTETDLAVATTVGQRIRSHVYAGTISIANRMVRANVHLGTAAFPKDKRAYKDLLVLADQRMQRDREVHRTAATASA